MSSKVVGKDEMFTVRRIERRSAAPAEAQSISFRQKLALRLTMLEKHFTEQSRPPFHGWVRVGDADENEWEPMPAHWEAALTNDGESPRAEVLHPDAGIRIELGVNFIHRRVQPLTPDYWYIEEAIAIRRLLDAPTHDAALEAAHALGELHEKAHLHGLHLSAVRRRRNQLKAIPKATASRKAKAAENTPLWHEEVLNRARELRRRKPDRSASAIARQIADQLEEKRSRHTVRRVIAKLWRSDS